MNLVPDSFAEQEGDVAREYRDLVNSLDDVVFRFDNHGRWTYLSPAWEKLGWSVASGLGQPAARFVHPDDRRHVFVNWRAVLEGRLLAHRCELRLRDTQGAFRWMLVSARGFRDGRGILRGGTGTLTDISTTKAAEAELVAARTAAESANRAKSEFLSTMSHELRTPLNAVIGLSESLLEMGAPFEADRTRRYLEIIRGSGRQLLAQINDILDLARIEAGRLTLNPETFDARTLATTAVESVQREVRAKALQVEVRNPVAPTSIVADERLLRQVAQNLVSNAVKFTEKGGRIRVELARSDRDELTFAVSDTGIGIAADKLALLFRPFSQIDSSPARQFGGTGLGLVLVDRIVRMHGGTVTVESAPRQGSTFRIRFPAAIFPAPPAPSPVPVSRRIVIVDDDPHQHTLVGDYLRHRGCEVMHFHDARVALQEIAALQPALAVVDINMPGMTGFELIAELRRQAGSANIPILAATALAEGDEARRCRDAGANAHIAKPLSLSALAQRIQHLTGLAL